MRMKPPILNVKYLEVIQEWALVRYSSNKQQEQIQSKQEFHEQEES